MRVLLFHCNCKVRTPEFTELAIYAILGPGYLDLAVLQLQYIPGAEGNTDPTSLAPFNIDPYYR